MIPIHKRLLQLTAIAFLSARAASAADGYTYTSIVDSSGALKEFDYLFPSINNKGAVVFHARFPASGVNPSGEGIYVSEGSGYRGIAVSGPVYQGFFANPIINDNGLVGFEAVAADGSESVLVGDGKTMGNKTIATSNSGRLYQFSPVNRFSDYTLALDENGRLAFTAQFQTTRDRGLFSGNGSEPEKTLFASSTGSSGVTLQPTSPAANASGQVAFYVVKANGVQELLRTTMNAAPTVVIATTAGDSAFSGFDSGSISINDAGRVGFVARLKAGGTGVFTSDGDGAPKQIITTATHPQFSGFRSASINNTGGIAFGGSLAAGGSNIFVVDPAGARNVLQADMFGSTLAGFYAEVTSRALNDLGQVVFFYELANGRQGIAVATPSNGVESKTLGNISTRLPVGTGDNALIGGFIVTGNAPKNVIIRGIGPSLAQAGISGELANPVLELRGGNGALLATNDDWRDTQEADIQNTGVAPTNNLESAILRTLTPGNYTAVLRGKGDSTGVGVIEAYDLNQKSGSTLANISTRGFVSVGDNVLIAGFIVGPYTKTVVRAIGPSLARQGIDNPLQNPTLDLVNGNGVVVASNNDWKDTQRAEIKATGLQPSDDREATLIRTLPAGNYTAVMRGVGGTKGVGVVEVYNLR